MNDGARRSDSGPAAWSIGDWTSPLSQYRSTLGRSFEDSRLSFGSADPRPPALAPAGLPRPRRHSSRNLGRASLSERQLAAVAGPIVEVGGIPPYPSAGALYPCHPILAQPVGAQLAQLSYVNGATRVIERVDTVDGRALAALVFEEWAWPVSCLLMVVVDLSRITMQYGERGIRFALLEAGTIVERVRAGAESAGLDSCLVGGYHDQDLLRLLGLDPRWFGVAILLAMGSAESAEPGGTP